MNSDNSKTFQFSNQLDIAFLNDLFEGDMEYAVTIFGDFLKDLPAYWLEVEDAYNIKSLDNLRSAVHKCKTLFGYVGHTQVLEIFQSFESKCSEVSDFRQILKDYSNLQDKKRTAEEIIKNEYVRLQQFQKRA